MKKPIDLVLLDLGNTLIYDKEPWPPLYERADAALWRVLHAAGIPLEPQAVYGEFNTLFGLYYANHRGGLEEPTTAAVLDGLLRKHGHVLPNGTLRAALRAMYAVTQSNWYPEDDAVPTLRILRERGFHVGVVSNVADDENVQALIDKCGLRPYVEHVLSSAAFGRRKPDPTIFRAALDHFGVTAVRTVMVGDSYEADILGGRAAGLNTIWITRRVRELPDSAATGADTTVSALGDIPQLLMP